jgi:hypothetical protein
MIQRQYIGVYRQGKGVDDDGHAEWYLKRTTYSQDGHALEKRFLTDRVDALVLDCPFYKNAVKEFLVLEYPAMPMQPALIVKVTSLYDGSIQIGHGREIIDGKFLHRHEYSVELCACWCRLDRLNLDESNGYMN